MFDTVKNFITNPTPEGLFAVMIFIVAGAIVAKIAYRMDVWKGKGWFKRSMLDLGTVCRESTSTASVEAKIVDTSGEQLRLEYEGESKTFGKTTETILIPFTMVGKRKWTVLGVAKQDRK